MLCYRAAVVPPQCVLHEYCVYLVNDKVTRMRWLWKAWHMADQF